MQAVYELLNRIPVSTLVRVASVAIPVLVALLIGNLLISVAERAALKRAGKRGQDLRVRSAIRLLRYLLAGSVLLIGAISYAGSWTGLGVSLGVVAAAAGFALQRPAASVAAWLTILLKKPFAIGDRIAIGEIARGDVIDLTLTHITLAEVGRWGAEDVSGRTVLVPNNVIFELPVTRYGSGTTRILGEVQFTVTYQSSVQRARELAEAIALETAGPKAKPHTRLKLADSGVTLELRFDVAVADANRVSSEISELILEAYRKEDEVELAYNRLDVQVLK